MVRFIAILAGLFAILGSASADDAIAPETVEAVKKATVLIRLEGDGWTSSGSGFVISADEKSAMIATNSHVVKPSAAAGARPSAKPGKLTVVFEGGTAAERTSAATVLAADAECDLAILKVEGVKNVATPIAYAESLKLVETMPVYTFGYPFGNALSSGKGNPAITVGKASISSLRNGPEGELAVVQIDGNLNPGNSGGPIVDAKGRLVGVAVARIRDGQGIGFAVPSLELARTMKGRAGAVRVTFKKAADGKASVRIEADMIDPLKLLKSATAYYLVQPAKAKKTEATALDKVAGSQSIELKIDGGIASAEITLPTAEGDVLVQVKTASESTAVATRMQSFALTMPKTVDVSGPPPAGWKEYSPKDKTFLVWVPEKPASQSERERTLTAKAQRYKVDTMAGKTADGLIYQAEGVVLPLAPLKPPVRGAKPPSTREHNDALRDALRDAFASELKGDVKETKKAEIGGAPGTEYLIVAGERQTRLRMLVGRTRVWIVMVTGSEAQVTGAEAETFLNSYRLTAAGKEDNGPAAAGSGGNPAAPRPVPRGKDPTVIAGAFDPQFKDLAPSGGLLVGFVLGTEKAGNRDVIRSVQPIYRTGDKETFGVQHGDKPENPVTVKAKPGYAVGAVTAVTTLTFDSMSVTFMKIGPDGLDAKDAYTSEWVGSHDARRQTSQSGDGTMVVGIVGKFNADSKKVTGLGLLFKGQESFDPTNGSNSTVQEKDPKILAGGADPKFKDAAPEGALLIGFELGTEKAFGHDMIRAVRPIYRDGTKETFGQQYGKKQPDTITIKAKEGYAVGAINAKTGLWFDGMSAIFMKVKDGELDLKDSYESDWVGTDEQKATTKLTGNGTPVIGIAGRTNPRELKLTGMGLLFKGQEAFDPARK